MKRIFPTLIISVIILANLFAPFEYSFKERNIQKIKAQAEEIMRTDCESALSFCVAVNGIRKSTDATGVTLFGFTLVKQYINDGSGQWYTAIIFKDDAGKVVDIITDYRQNEPKITSTSTSAYYKGGGDKEWLETQTGFKQTKLLPEKTYTIEVTSAKIKRATANLLQTTNTDDIYKTFPVSFYDLSWLNGTKENIDPSQMVSASTSITMPAKGQIGQDAKDSSVLEGATNTADIMPECGVTGSATIIGCVAQTLYYLIYIPTSWGMWAAGLFMDFSLNYSLDSASYNNGADFVTKAWSFIRDLCNIFFIVSMLYIALGQLFELKGISDWKKPVGKLVIAALAINFSLFVTKIPIDLGNIAARVFYNSDLIKVSKVSDSGETTGTLSEAVVEGFNPQNILYQGLTKINSVAGENDIEEKSAKGGFSTTTFIIVTIFAIIINWIALWIFFQIGLLFIGRVVSLWYHMILSPLAFVSDYIPSALKVGDFSFKKWMEEIVKLSIMPVIFMAFIYIILLFISLTVPALQKDGESSFAWIIGTVVPFVFIIIMLKKAKSTTESFADSMAKQVSDYAGKAIGTVAGLAAGGVGFAGKRIIGSKLAGLADNAGLKDAASKGGIGGAMARMTLKGADYGSKASFDLRGTDAFKRAGMEDLSAKSGVSKFFGTNLKDGGYVGAEKRRKEEHDKRMKQFAANDDEYKALKAKEEKRLGDQFNKDEFEKKYGKSADELNIKRQAAYAENIKNKKGISGRINMATGYVTGNNTVDEKFADKVLKDNKKKQEGIDKKKKQISKIDIEMATISDNLTVIDEYFEKLSTNANFTAIKNKIEQDESAAKATNPSYKEKSSEEIEALSRNKYENELRTKKEDLAREQGQHAQFGVGAFPKMAELQKAERDLAEFTSNKEKQTKLDSDYDKLEARKNKLSPKDEKKEDKKDDEKK